MGLDLQRFIVLNGVGVVSNDSVSVYINAAAVFEDSTLNRSQCLQLSEKKTPETHHWRRRSGGWKNFFFFNLACPQSTSERMHCCPTDVASFRLLNF